MMLYGDYKRADDIKAPQGEEEEIDWFYYDQDVSTTNAGTTVTFFDKTESGDGDVDTNMPMAGQLPGVQRFSINTIQVELDHEAATGDLQDLLDNAILELKISDRRKFIAPLNQFVPSGQLRPADSTSSTDTPELAGQPYRFTIPIGLKGNTSFTVDITVGATAVSATMDMRVMLGGLLIRPRS